MMPTVKVSCNTEGVTMASSVIKDGGIIIFPTDTVYGIGCDPYNKKSVEKIYRIKTREKTKSLPVLAYSMGAASEIASFDKQSWKLAQIFWPGPLTLIVKLTDERLRQSLNLGEKIALRVPKNNCTLDLLKKCGFLIGTSANISGQEPFTDPLKCDEKIRGFDLFLDGGKISGMPSTITEIVEGEVKILREGVLTEKEIMKVL